MQIDNNSINNEKNINKLINRYNQKIVILSLFILCVILNIYSQYISEYILASVSFIFYFFFCHKLTYSLIKNKYFLFYYSLFCVVLLYIILIVWYVLFCTTKNNIIFIILSPFVIIIRSYWPLVLITSIVFLILDDIKYKEKLLNIIIVGFLIASYFEFQYFLLSPFSMHWP